MVKPGSIWWASNGDHFRVIARVEVQGEIWVQYINTRSLIEYSCLEVSFLYRFRENTNQK
jgi:hypothetical protein